MSEVLKYAAGIVSLIPGLGILLEGIAVPPGTRWVFGGVLAAAPPFFVLALVLYRRQLRAANRRSLLRWSGIAFGTFLFALGAYAVLQEYCLVSSTEPDDRGTDPVFFPLWLNGELRDRVRSVNGRQAAVNQFGPTVMRRELDRMSGVGLARNVTIAVMLLVAIVFTGSLAVAFGLLGFHLAPPEDGVRHAPPAVASLAGAVTGDEAKRLHAAVLFAFNENSLEQLMDFRMKVKLFDEIQRQEFKQVVYDLIDWLNEQGRMSEFLDAIEKERPKNQEFLAAVANVRARIRKPIPPGESPTDPKP